MTNGKIYHEKVHEAIFQSRPIPVRSLTPEFSAQEQKKIKSEISQSLYEIFSKYRKPG